MAGDGSHGSLRRQVRFYLLDHRTVVGQAIDIVLLALNLLFVALFVVETYPVADQYRAELWALEVGITFVFVFEYLLRLYGADSRVSELLNGYTVVDLLSVLPTLLLLTLPSVVTGINLGYLRVVRVIRVLRFYRFTKDREFFFGTVSDNTLRAMTLLLSVLVILFTSAGLFYSAEVATNPEIQTFGDAFYFTVVSLSTVGFGDILPTTAAGRWITVASILAAIIVIPRQASKIVREWATRDKVQTTCENCGLAAHDRDASHCKACGHVIYQEFEGQS